MFPLDDRLHHQVWWHILYTGGRKQKKRRLEGRRRTKPKAETEREREQENEKEEERRIDRCFLELSGVLIA